MNKNIVVFGCDNSGKTTLCEMLKKQYPEFKIIKSLGANKTADEQIGFMDKELSESGIKVFDRFPIIEEAICGKIFRGKDNFEKLPYRFAWKLLSQIDLFIHCDPGYLNVVQWGEREQMDGVKENVEALYNAYNVFAGMLEEYGYDIIKWNYSIDKFEKIHKVLEEALIFGR